MLLPAVPREGPVILWWWTREKATDSTRTLRRITDPTWFAWWPTRGREAARRWASRAISSAWIQPLDLEPKETIWEWSSRGERHRRSVVTMDLPLKQNRRQWNFSSLQTLRIMEQEHPVLLLVSETPTGARPYGCLEKAHQNRFPFWKIWKTEYTTQKKLKHRIHNPN